jgi:glycosyltransferase involved in cell wall biosynthesis
MSESAHSAPEVSVVIPTRDRWRFLERALAVALGQRDVELEVIVVADGCSDETAERLAEIDDPRVRPLLLAASQGVARARNLGAAQARAPWLSFLDDDDLWAPERTRTMLDAAGDAALVAGGYVIVADGDPVDVAFPPAPARLPVRLLFGNAVGGPSNAILRRSVFEEVGGFDPGYEVLADWELWLRVLQGRTAATVGEPVNGYVIHEGSMHRLRTEAAVEEYARMRRLHADFARRLGGRFDRRYFRRWIGDAHRASGRRAQALRCYLPNLARYRSREDLECVLSMSKLMRPDGGRVPSPIEGPAWLDEIPAERER